MSVHTVRSYARACEPQTGGASRCYQASKDTLDGLTMPLGACEVFESQDIPSSSIRDNSASLTFPDRLKDPKN